MLMMKWSNPRYNEQPLAAAKTRQPHHQSDWIISSNVHAPFECIRVYSKGLKNITEVASIDSVQEQFINGGGSIARAEMYIPGIGSLISCRDCAGHLFSFFEAESPVRPEHITGIDQHLATDS